MFLSSNIYANASQRRREWDVSVELEDTSLILHQRKSINYKFGAFTKLSNSKRSFEVLLFVLQMENRHRKKETPAPASTHHLFVHVKSLMSANLGEELEVFFHIYDGREGRPLR